MNRLSNKKKNNRLFTATFNILNIINETTILNSAVFI